MTHQKSKLFRRFQVKGTRTYRSHKIKSMSSPKKALYRRIRPFNHGYRQPTNLALKARIRICGPRWARRFKFKAAAKHHLNRKRSRNNLKRKRLDRYVHKVDERKVRKLMPYFKRQQFKQNH